MRSDSGRVAVSLVLSCILSLALVACGSETKEPAEKDVSGSASASAPATVATSAAPQIEPLSKRELKSVLLTIDDLPPGYSQDPPSKDEGNKYFCDYKPPVEEKARFRRDFTKAGGMSAEVLSLTIRQFESAEDARASWDVMVSTLKTCKSEVYDGSTLHYSRMSAPEMGDASAGVKIEADGVTIVQTFVLVGPALVSGGSGGLMDVDVDAATAALQKQVDRYESAATS